MQVTLARVSSAGGIPQSYHLASPILEQGSIVGRNNDSDIVLNTDLLPLLISRKHAKLYVVGHALLLQDEGSTNGTYVDEGRLSPNDSKKLVNGNVVSFGGPKLVIRDGQQHQNPFIYHVSIVESVTGQAHRRQDLDNEATQAAEAPESNVAAASAASAAPVVEHSVDLTRASSSEASIVDLTGSPDIRVGMRPVRTAREPAAALLSNQQVSHGTQQQQKRHHRANPVVGQKRTKSMNEAAVVAFTAAQASASDGGARQALENEFECTICRDFMVATHSVVPCGHMFCGECLSEWLQKNPTCPKCRAAATAPPVRTMAVDNVLESVVEKGMSKEELQERQQRKHHWDAHAAVINSNMKHLFRHGGNRPPHGFPGPFGQQGHSAALNWEALAAMQQGIGMLINPHMHRQAPRRAPSPPRYTVTTNGSTARVLCKGCRNPIPQHCTQIGYSERGQMRWYHLGCLSGDRWQAAAAPGRLSGLPQLRPNQQGDVHRRLSASRPTR